MKQTLIDEKPIGVLIDEIDKMKYEHYEFLLSLCEGGIVKITLFNRHDEAKLTRTIVVACCNTIERLPAEVRSRFFVYPINRYTPAEFREVSYNVMKREYPTLDNKRVQEIVDKFTNRFIVNDIRDIIKIARLSNYSESIDELINTYARMGILRRR